MAAKTKAAGKPQKAAATPTPTVGRPAVFGPTQCHQRDAKGNPSCKNEKQPGRNLCPTHEKVWQAEAKKRRAARIASGTPAPNAPKGTNSAGTSKASAGVKRAKDANPASGRTPTREIAPRTTAKPHPMSVLRTPVQRQPSATAELIAPKRGK